MDPLLGRTLDNKYLIEKLLGKGGMGSVYQAIHTGTKRTVAVKIIAPHLMRNRELLIRFQREAEASGRLRHPNVVNVTDFGVTVIDLNSLAYLVMEYLDGETLHDFLQREPLPPPAMVIDILEQIALGVTEAHSHGILHRDLKPGNIWLQPDGRGGTLVKVLDFGIAKLADPSSLAIDIPDFEAPPNLDPTPADDDATVILPPTELGLTSAFAESSGFSTTVGSTLGTPAFMSPEQCSGQPVSEKSDLYSLAMLAYLMLAGELPFKGNAREFIEQQINQAPAPPHTRNPKLSELVSQVILESLAKDPNHRALSCLSFVGRLRASIEGEVHLLKESRASIGSTDGSWFAVIALAALPAAGLALLARLAIRHLLDIGHFPDWLGFACLILIEIFLVYCSLILADLAMTGWVIRSTELGATPVLFLHQMWRALLALPKSLLAAVFTRHPVAHALAPVLILMEGLSIPAARARSALLLRGAEHLVIALLVRRLAMAWLACSYLPFIFIALQLPLFIVYRESLGGSLAMISTFASMSVLPGYGSFLLTWKLLYDRGRQNIGEINRGQTKRYEKSSGRVGQGLRLGTCLWIAIPIIISLVLIVAPFTSWNSVSRDILAAAAREGRFKDLRALLEAGEDPNPPSRRPNSYPLEWAINNGDMPSALLLLDRGANPNHSNTIMALLHYAVQRHRPDMVKLLLDRRADPNIRDEHQATPLIFAARSGQPDLVALLLARGADRSLTDDRGKSALTYAREQGHTEIVRLLESQ
jgi:serine/threonine protein kinase/ankyrin repeat protein